MRRRQAHAEARRRTLALKLIDDAERHLSLPRLNDNVTPGADDRVFSIFVCHRNQGDMVHEVNV